MKVRCSTECDEDFKHIEGEKAALINNAVNRENAVLPDGRESFLTKRLAERGEEVERLREKVAAAEMAKTRLNDFADKANAGQVHHDARELKRKIWAAFAEFDAASE